MFMCVVNLKSVNKLDLTWKQSFLIYWWTANFSDDAPCTSLKDFLKRLIKPFLHATQNKIQHSEH